MAPDCPRDVDATVAICCVSIEAFEGTKGGAVDVPRKDGCGVCRVATGATTDAAAGAKEGAGAEAGVGGATLGDSGCAGAPEASELTCAMVMTLPVVAVVVVSGCTSSIVPMPSVSRTALSSLALAVLNNDTASMGGRDRSRGGSRGWSNTSSWR